LERTYKDLLKDFRWLVAELYIECKSNFEFPWSECNDEVLCDSQSVVPAPSKFVRSTEVPSTQIRICRTQQSVLTHHPGGSDAQNI
jgi:hypothetical protein